MLPEIHLFGSLSVPTYFLVISIACVISTLWFLQRAEARHLERLIAIDLAMITLIGGFVGARLLHVAYEDPGFYNEHPWSILEVWNGGFVFFGGLIGSSIAAFLFCQFQGEPFWYWADTAVLPLSLGYALGRIACLLNGCCYGKVCELPWAISLNGEHRHPSQLYASVWELALLLLLKWLEPRLRTSGILFNLWLLGHALGRLLMEHFRDDPRGDLILNLSLGSWISIALAAFAAIQLLSVSRQPVSTLPSE